MHVLHDHPFSMRPVNSYNLTSIARWPSWLKLHVIHEMFQRPRGGAAPWVRGRSRTPAPGAGSHTGTSERAQASNPVVGGLEFGGQLVPSSLSQSFQLPTLRSTIMRVQ